MKMKKISVISLLVMSFMLLVSCGQANTTTPSDSEPVALTVSAAASMTEAMQEVEVAYEAANPNVDITMNFASSGSLQNQIEQGADVDVFASASVGKMNALQDKGLILEDTRKNFLENKVVLIVPKDSTADITSFDDLATDKVNQIGIGEPDSVPVGQYSKQILTSLNLFDTIQSKVVFGKDVKEVLTWVETGNVDAGMVYSTDANVSDKVTVVANAPDDTHEPICYPAAVIKDSKNVDAAKAFVNYLYSSEAKPIFEKYGFTFIAE